MTLATNGVSESLTIMHPHLRSNRSLELQRNLDRAERIKRFGLVPDNPFLVLRKAENFTLIRVAREANMDSKGLSRLEQGMYVSPSPAAVRYWTEVLPRITEGTLYNEYEDFQHYQRARHKFFFGPSLITDISGGHPFRELRSRRPALVPELQLNYPLPVGITDLCAALCVPLDTVQFWEKKWRNQQTVPKIIKAALNEIGYSRDHIWEFEAHYKAWRLANKQVRMS